MAAQDSPNLPFDGRAVFGNSAPGQTTNNNALQFAAGSGYRVDPIPCRGTADEAPA
jgi:hypothetical protein